MSRVKCFSICLLVYIEYVVSLAPGAGSAEWYMLHHANCTSNGLINTTVHCSNVACMQHVYICTVCITCNLECHKILPCDRTQSKECRNLLSQFNSYCWSTSTLSQSQQPLVMSTWEAIASYPGPDRAVGAWVRG